MSRFIGKWPDFVSEELDRPSRATLEFLQYVADHKDVPEGVRQMASLNFMGPCEGALEKSTYDEFDYSLKLTTGEVIRYRGAEIISADWIRLTGARPDNGEPNNDGPEVEFPRGIDVRVSQIVWVKDAPYGS